MESFLVGSGVAARAIQRRAGQVLVLAYHNVVPDGMVVGDASLHLALSDFRSHLELLRHSADVVSLDSALAVSPGDSAPAYGERIRCVSAITPRRARVAITFDDAYAGALEFAVPELVRRGMPATIFVAPGLLGHADTWWDRYATADGLSDHFRRGALTTCAGDEARVDAWARSTSIAPLTLPREASIASAAMLSQLADTPGITLGCHTWDHPNLTALSATDIRSQLQRSIAYLARFDCSRPWLAYPYGLESAVVRTVASEYALTHAFRVDGGFVRADDDALGLPRYNVAAGLSRNGLHLRLGGLLLSR